MSPTRTLTTALLAAATALTLAGAPATALAEYHDLTPPAKTTIQAEYHDLRNPR